MHGQPRRYADFTLYEFLNTPTIRGMNSFMTVSALLLGATQLILVYNFIHSLVAGERAPANPWRSNTLEWSTASPPPHYNFQRIPTVYHSPYEYGVPGHIEDHVPQIEPMSPDPQKIDPVMA